MAALFKIKKGSTYVDLTDNLTQFKVDDEIIWSSNAGRNTKGNMTGTVIAEKATIALTWEYVTAEYVKKIKDNMVAGFFEASFRDCGENTDIKGYRGTLSKEYLGHIGDGKEYYKSVTVTFIQK